MGFSQYGQASLVGCNQAERACSEPGYGVLIM